MIVSQLCLFRILYGHVGGGYIPLWEDGVEIVCLKDGRRADGSSPVKTPAPPKSHKVAKQPNNVSIVKSTTSKAWENDVSDYLDTRPLIWRKPTATWVEAIERKEAKSTKFVPDTTALEVFPSLPSVRRQSKPIVPEKPIVATTVWKQDVLLFPFHF